MQVRQDSSGRVQPVEGKYLAHPGTCFMCSRPPKKPEEIWANLGNVEYDIDSTGYLCLDCCAEIADFIMFINPEKYARAMMDLEAVESANETLTAKVEYLRGLLNARIDLAGSSEPDSDGAPNVPVSTSELTADDIDRILNDNESKPVKSGKG